MTTAKAKVFEGDYPHMETDPGAPFEDPMADVRDEEEPIEIHHLREYVRRLLRTILKA